MCRKRLLSKIANYLHFLKIFSETRFPHSTEEAALFVEILPLPHSTEVAALTVNVTPQDYLSRCTVARVQHMELWSKSLKPMWEGWSLIGNLQNKKGCHYRKVLRA